ncbi:unnamed protein product, partial [Heterosigma akashiwo]
GREQRRQRPQQGRKTPVQEQEKILVIKSDGGHQTKTRWKWFRSSIFYVKETRYMFFGGGNISVDHSRLEDDAGSTYQLKTSKNILVVVEYASRCLCSCIYCIFNNMKMCECYTVIVY